MRIYTNMLAHFMMNLEFLQLDEEYEETMQFYRKQKADKIEQIGKLEDVFHCITNYGEKNALIERLEKGVEYYDKMLDLLHKLRQKSENSPDGTIDFETSLHREEEYVSDNEYSKKPMDMLRSEFKQIYSSRPLIENMKDLLELFFEQNKSLGYISLEQITQMLYDTETPEEFKTAKNSIAAQLRRGADEGRWQKIGRGNFASNNYNNPEAVTSSSDRKSETSQDYSNDVKF